MSEDKIYNFFGWHQFKSFLSMNHHKIFPSVTGGPEETGTLLHLRDKIELFNKICNNAHGGCPCNKKKRVQQAVDSYKEVVNDFSKTQEARSTVFSVLGNPTAIHFYETENALALKQSQPDQALPEPFAKVSP
jgi:hypothetical protein